MSFLRNLFGGTSVGSRIIEGRKLKQEIIDTSRSLSDASYATNLADLRIIQLKHEAARIKAIENEKKTESKVATATSSDRPIQPLTDLTDRLQNRYSGVVFYDKNTKTKQSEELKLQEVTLDPITSQRVVDDLHTKNATFVTNLANDQNSRKKTKAISQERRKEFKKTVVEQNQAEGQRQDIINKGREAIKAAHLARKSLFSAPKIPASTESKAEFAAEASAPKFSPK